MTIQVKMKEAESVQQEEKERGKTQVKMKEAESVQKFCKSLVIRLLQSF